MKHSFKSAMAALAAAAVVGTSMAAEGTSPVQGIAHLDHVFLIMMENHAYGQVIGNPNMPFFNRLAAKANLATNYFAVGHPSLTNYLEIVGGSNFGVRNDNSPNWHAAGCSPGYVYLEGDSTKICPILGIGTDAATPIIDYSNETSGPPGVIDVNGAVGYLAATGTSGKTIADQLVAHGLSWKAYEESLPPTGADRVNSADGLFSNINLIANPAPIPPALQTAKFSVAPAQTGTVDGSVQGLYAVKHNPFAYFAGVQAGTNPASSLGNIVGYGGTNGLFGDLATGNLPSLVYIVPNQCHDQHGREGATAGPECAYDPNDNGTLIGLNPALMYEGDAALERLVGAIKSSPAWNVGRNAIVIVWDENDYSISPTTNQVPLVVDSNDEYGYGVQSSQFYTHFSLLKTLEAGFGLPCLNHACDTNVAVMSDLFPRR